MELAAPDLRVEHAVLRATPAVMPVDGSSFAIPWCARLMSYSVGQAMLVGRAF